VFLGLMGLQGEREGDEEAASLYAFSYTVQAASLYLLHDHGVGPAGEDAVSL